jgi:hypothetical protein
MSSHVKYDGNLKLSSPHRPSHGCASAIGHIIGVSLIGVPLMECLS